MVAIPSKCIGCGKTPKEISEYCGHKLSPEQYVFEEEGTYNDATGQFACTECYIKMGCPSKDVPDKWVAGDPV